MSEEMNVTEAIEAPAIEAVEGDTTTPVTEAPIKTEEEIRAENIAKSKAGTDPETQRKFDKLTWEKNQERREREKVTAELDAIKKRPAGIAFPEPENFPGGEFDPAYIQALIDYGKKTGESEITARMRQENEVAMVKQRNETIVTTFENRAEKLRRDLPDFDAVAKAPEMIELYRHPQMTPIVDALYESEVGPRLAYYFGKNPGEAYRLANLPWQSALRELGRLEAKIVTETVTRKVSQAPDPINPIGAGANITEKSPEEMSPSEFAVWRRGFVKKRH